MRMREVDSVDLPAGKKIVFEPGGYHIMLLGLKKKLVEGERFPLTLEFEKAGKITVDIAVDKPGAGAVEHKH
jgi:copper(I)-binding protein